LEKKLKPKSDNEEQSQRFVDTAKMLEVDESGKLFDRAFKKITPVIRKSTARKKSTNKK
jgi:hypothetical protein